MHVDVKEARATELSKESLYGILRLRIEVLVVEQNVPYLDLDGRDIEPETIHIWAESGTEIVSAVRLVREPDNVWRLGRLCTAHHARGRGIARRLVLRALELAGDDPVDADTLRQLVPWYESFGFAITGPAFHEVGVPHMPMRLTKNVRG